MFRKKIKDLPSKKADFLKLRLALSRESAILRLTLFVHKINICKKKLILSKDKL